MRQIGGPAIGVRWIPRRPSQTHITSERSTREKPNSRSSTGAKAIRPSPMNAGAPLRAKRLFKEYLLKN